MSRRMLGYTVFYGLGVGSAMLAMAVLVPLISSGSPLAAGGATHALIEDGAGACPYLGSGGSSPRSAIEGEGSGSICPYLAGRASACPYLREQAGAGVMPAHPDVASPEGDGWFDRTPRPRAAALLQVGRPTGHEPASAGWF